MTYQRLPYEDAAPTPEMISDCAQVGRALHLRARTDRRPADSAGPRFDGSTRRERAGTVVVPDSLADLAREMQLHLG